MIDTLVRFTEINTHIIVMMVIARVHFMPNNYFHPVIPKLKRRLGYEILMLPARPLLWLFNQLTNTSGRLVYIYLLTYSMVQSPSWEADWFAASQEIPRISWNPKVHYRTHKRPPPISILGPPNPVHIHTSHLPEIHPNIIHPSTPRSPQWSLSLRLPHQDPIHPPLLTHTRLGPSPSHSSRFYNSQNIGWGVQII